MSTIFTNQQRGSANLTWDGDTGSWDDNVGSWDNPFFYHNQAKSASILANQQRSGRRLGDFTIAELATDTFLTLDGSTIRGNESFDTVVTAGWANQTKS